MPIDALDTFPIGLRTDDPHRPCTTWPETDAAGRGTGINRRWKAGTGPLVNGERTDKQFLPGGKRGLTLPAGWCGRPGPAFVAEGPTAAAALTAAGLSAVGTHAAGQGAKLFAALLKGLPADRDILVVGENDEKPDGRMGADGASRLATALAAALRRPIRWALVPDGGKDSRAWLTHPDRGETAWPDRGTELAGKQVAVAVAVNPPAPPSAGNNGGESGPTGDRPEIVVGTDEHRVNDEAVAALARESDIYQRGGMLVHLIEQEALSDPDDVVRRPAGVPVVRELAKPLLRERFIRVAEWSE